MLGKKERILALLKEGKSAKEVAKIVGVTAQNIYNVVYQNKKSSVKAKAIVRNKKAAKKNNYRWVPVDQVDPRIAIESMRHEIIGYKAIISYLEYRLGLSSTQ